MYKSLIIKKIAAAAILIIFAFSITPTIVFHNWLANHTDTANKSADTKGEQISDVTFNCHCDNIVAQSPFTEAAVLSYGPAENIFSVASTERKVQFISSSKLLTSLRGPPAV